MTGLFRRLRARIKYRDFDTDLGRELAAHRELKAAAFEAQGMTTRHARAAAARALGNVTLAREDSRAMWIPTVLQQLAQDARYALRGMRRAPAFTIAAVLMLTIGLGLIAGVYTVVNGLFLRGWAIPDTARVFRALAQRPPDPGSAGRTHDGFSLGAVEYLNARAHTADYAGYQIEHFMVSDRSGDRGTSTQGMIGTDTFFETLRIPLQLGSGFRSPSGGDSRAVISHRLWRYQFGADPEIIGRTIWLKELPVVVVGVMAAGFEGLGERPLGVVADANWARADGRRFRRGSEEWFDGRLCCVSVAGRMRDGWSREQVREELALLTAQYRGSIAQPDLQVSLGSTVPAASIQSAGELVGVLGLIGAGITLVLLLTCANVGNLFLARTLRRQREIAVRLSLGAGRARIVRQLVTEGLVLAAIAGAGALLVATAVPALLSRVVDDAEATMYGTMFALDWRVAAFTAAGIVFTCLVVSLAPALQATRIAWRGAMPMMATRTGRTRSIVLAAQIAIAAVLVLSAALIARGIGHALNAPADFALHTTTAIQLSAPAGLEAKARSTAVAQALRRAAAQVDLRVGLSGMTPVSRNGGLSTSVRQPHSDLQFRAQAVLLSAAAASILDLRLASGRWHADERQAREAVINGTLARQIWGDANPIGQPLWLHFDDQIYTVVGVTHDAHLTSLSRVGPMVHIPPTGGSGLDVLLARSEPALESRIRAAIAKIDPTLTVTLIPLTQSVMETLQAEIAGATIAGSLAMVALALAIIGVFGVFSYLIEERRREIGIRLALGASRVRLGRALFQATRGAVVGGLAAGLVLSAIAGVLLRSFLFGLSPADPISYGAVAMVLMVAALAATAIPLRRALRVDPAVTLRAE
jgi:predicted permease